MELANILELIHAVSDSDLTEFNLQDDTLNISMSKEKTIVQQMAVNTDPADAQQYQPVCLLYTSDAADERSSVDLSDRRNTKKKKKQKS